MKQREIAANLNVTRTFWLKRDGVAIIPMNAIFVANSVILTYENDLTKLLLQLVCHEVKSKLLNKYHRFSFL